MAAIARAAEASGATVRANSPEYAVTIREVINIPIIGILKQEYSGSDVFITPTFESARIIVQAGASIIALDGTTRLFPGGTHS
ncbi:hypothetical protein ACFLYO_08135 [Chloroflexota bacterium]